jgi:Uma2 family endonuclease
VYPSDLRVWNPITRSHTFPDVVVVCGESRLNGDGENDVLLNPTLLIEVLSPSTEAKDRGGKAESFRRLDSLQEYLLVSQFEPHIEHYRRYDERQWMLTEATHLADALELGSIGCTLALSDIYQNVAVSPAEDDAAHTDSDHG